MDVWHTACSACQAAVPVDDCAVCSQCKQVLCRACQGEHGCQAGEGGGELGMRAEPISQAATGWPVRGRQRPRIIA